MADASLVLLQSMVQRVLDGQQRVETTLREVVDRLGRVEQQVAGLHVDFAALSVRMDKFNDRLVRVEKRLELVEA